MIPYRLLLTGGGILILLILAYIKGIMYAEEKYYQKELEYRNKIQKLQLEKATVTTKIVTEYVDKVKIIEGTAKEIIKYVPKYISTTSNQECRIPVGFVKLHNYAASNGAVVGSTEDADETAPGITLTDVIERVGENYVTYHETAERLKSLQEWVNAQDQLNKESSNGR